MTVHGDVETAGVVKIEGVVNGHVTAGQQVLVAKGGQIDGDVDTGEAVIGGAVHGAVRAHQRVEVQAGATVQGDVTTKRIAVAEGAVINGLVKMGDVEETARAMPQRPLAQPTLPRPSTSWRAWRFRRGRQRRSDIPQDFKSGCTASRELRGRRQLNCCSVNACTTTITSEHINIASRPCLVGAASLSL